MDQSSHTPLSSGTSWKRSSSYLVCRWRRCSGGSRAKGSLCWPPRPCLLCRRWADGQGAALTLPWQSWEGSSSASMGTCLAGDARARVACVRPLHGSSLGQILGLFLNFSAMLPLPVQGQECLCLRRNCREPCWITGWFEQALISLKIKAGKGGKGRRPNSFVAYPAVSPELLH